MAGFPHTGAYVPVAHTQASATETVWKVTPNQAATPSDFSFQIQTGTFGGVTESMLAWGYNIGRANAADYAGWMSILPNCGDSQALQMQWNLEAPDGTFYNPVKLFFKTDGTKSTQWVFDFEGSEGQFVIGKAGTPLFTLASDGTINFNELTYANSTLIAVGDFAHRGANLGFYNVARGPQPSAAGSATGYAAGATAATFHSDDTYTGNVGSHAYTVNGIVAALKTLGLIAS